jgi:hypothetical protein
MNARDARSFIHDGRVHIRAAGMPHTINKRVVTPQDLDIRLRRFQIGLGLIIVHDGSRVFFLQMFLERFQKYVVIRLFAEIAMRFSSTVVMRVRSALESLQFSGRCGDLKLPGVITVHNKNSFY